MNAVAGFPLFITWLSYGLVYFVPFGVIFSHYLGILGESLSKIKNFVLFL